MSACIQRIDNKHRQVAEYPALCADGPAVRIAPWSYAWNRGQAGRLPNGGCLYGGQTTTYWAPMHALLHLTHGPAGCSVYAHANRAGAAGAYPVRGWPGLNLGTDFQERDIVFGGETKLARAMAEADALFPAQSGLTVFSTCPVALIGDDIDAVARRHARTGGRIAQALHCAGFRRTDGLGAMQSAILETWRNWRDRSVSTPEDDAVVLLCRESHGAWQAVAQWLAGLGLAIVAHWPVASGPEQVRRFGRARCAISIDMDEWGERFAREYGVPWVAADFLGPDATTRSLRAIAQHCSASTRARIAAEIAREAPAAQAVVDIYRARLSGRLYFSFAPLMREQADLYAAFGMRAGSSLQGWPDTKGRWCYAPQARRYPEMTPAEIAAVLALARPDFVDGVGQDLWAMRKRGYAVFDDAARAALSHAAVGYRGTTALAQVLTRLARVS